MAKYITVYLHLGHPETGLWCPQCNLPSGIYAPIYAMFSDGMTPCGYISRCEDCGCKDIEVPS